jgi:hypothetical protein
MQSACTFLKRRFHYRSPARGIGGPSPAGPLCHGPARGRSPTRGRGGPSPHCHSPAGGRGGPNSPPYHSPTGTKGMPCLGRLLISIDFDCFRVLFVARFSKLNCILIADRCQLHAAKGYFLCHTSIFNNLHFNY